MLYLLVTPFFYAGFSLGVRAGQRRGTNLLAVGAVNYFLAALVYLTAYLLRPVTPDPRVIALGLGVGVLYAFGFLLILPTMRDRGVAVVVAIMQLSVLVPASASIIIWNETPTALRAFGAGLCLLAMPLLALDKGVSRGRLTWGKGILFAALFLVGGCSQTGNKWFDEMGAPEQSAVYFICLFGAATVVSVLSWAAMRQKTKPDALLWGSVVGFSNAGAGIALITALRQYEGYVVFPLVQAMSLATVVIFAAAVWREIPGRLALAGIALAITASIVINI